MNRIVEDTCDLIRLNTTNPDGNEVIAANWLKKRTEKFGMQVKITEVLPSRSNCIAEYDFGAGPTFVLCTHLDVVPGSKEQFEPKVLEKKIFGRGACDAKGALAAMISACERAIVDSENFSGKLVIAAVVDEEVGASGAQHLLAAGFKADAVIIGEPTSNKILLKSRGVVRAKIVIEGTPGHASMPHKSVNAISAASLLINELDLLNKKLALNEEGTCSVTMVKGGTAVNVIPDKCELVVDLRVAPHITIKSAEEDLDSIIKECLITTGSKWYREQAGVNVHPLNIDLNSNFAHRIKSSDRMEIGSFFPAVTDAPHFAESGIATAILGPGNIEQAHTESEWIEINELEKAADLYFSLIHAFLKKPE